MSGGNDNPLTFGQALRKPEFWLLLTAAVGATLGLAWWFTVPSVVAGLSIAGLPKYIELWPRARELPGGMTAWWMTVVLSTINAIVMGCAAHLLGVFSGWLWA